MAVTYITVKQGESDTAIVDCGDNATVDTSSGALPRLILGAGESVSSVTLTVQSKPTGASDPTLGTPAVIASNTECNGRIVGSGEGFTFDYTMASGQALGVYRITCAITKNTSAVVPACVVFEVVNC